MSFDLEGAGTREFFEQHDALYRNELPFTVHLFEFEGHPGHRVLDVGCGPGWLVRNFARGGAHICGVDLTAAAATLTKCSLELYELGGAVAMADAESLPF